MLTANFIVIVSVLGAIEIVNSSRYYLTSQSPSTSEKEREDCYLIILPAGMTDLPALHLSVTR